MKFFEDNMAQVNKRNHPVCGDYCICDRTTADTIYVLADGVGSGVYANISAIFCANRLVELYRSGVSQREAAELVAESMHRARQEDMPFVAFSMAKILPDGQFTVYSYEAPQPIAVLDGRAQPLQQRFYTSYYETVAETVGTLQMGDSLVLCSDGVTQAGLGHGYGFGIGTEGLVNFINRKLMRGQNLTRFCHTVIEMTRSISGGVYEDDTTIAMLQCREANELTIFSGPPADRKRDAEFARRFRTEPGRCIICGSTTADVISRELKREIKMVNMDLSYGSPPEYKMEGATMVTEGAMVLNQLLNLLDEDPRNFVEKTPVERLCLYIHEADVITFVIGDAVNDAHTNMMFKQVGVRPRHTVIDLIAENLRKKGKLVVMESWKGGR